MTLSLVIKSMKYLAIEFTSTKVYIDVQKITGKNIFLERKIVIDIPADTMINGAISEYSSLPSLIANELKKYKVTCKKAFVTIDNPECKTEEISIINTNAKNLDGIVMQELSKRRKISSDSLYDYRVIGPDPSKEGFILVDVIFAPRIVVEGVYETLKKAGLIPFRLNISSYILQLFAHDIGLPSSDMVSIIICMTDTGIHLFYSGKNADQLYNYVPIKQDSYVSEEFIIDDDEEEKDINTPEKNSQMLADTVLENVLKYIRYHQQQNNGKVSGVYLYGDCSNEEFDLIIQELEDEIECEAGVIDIFDFETIKGNEIESYMYNAIITTREYLINPKGSINLFSPYTKKKGSGIGSSKFLLSLFSLFAVCTVLVFGYYGYKKVQINALNTKIEECNTYINDSKNQELYAEASKMNDEYLKYMNYNEKCKKYIEALQTRQKFQSEIIKSITDIAAGSIIINGYDFNDTTLKMTCLCSGKDDPAKFSELLTNSNKFLDVKYSGFQQNSSSEYGQYSFDLEITLWNERREPNV